MRIGINLLYLIPSVVGGTETHATELLKALAEQHSDETLILYTNDENHSKLKELFKDFKQVEICSLNFKAMNRFSRMFQEQFILPRKAKEYKVDVLLSLGYTPSLFTNIPQVVFVHDMQYKNFKAAFSPLARFMMNFLVVNGVRKCALVMTPSEFSKQEVVKYTSVSPDKVVAIHHGINKEFSRELPEEVLEETFENIQGLFPPYLLCVGYSHPQKNIVTLIRAFAEIMDEIPHQLLLIGGAGRDEENVIQEIKKLPSERVLRLSNVKRKYLLSLYQKADLFVFPSLYEGFGFPVLEAMNSCVPVIATDNSSLKEVMNGNAMIFDGTVEDLKVKIKKGIELSPYERDEIISKAKKWSNTFTWERAAEKTVFNLRETLERAKANK